MKAGLLFSEAGLLFRQGQSPHATYLFKHALVQDAAYGTLLRESRRALHAQIAETLEGQFAELTETRPELLALQCADAGLIEKAAGLWGSCSTHCEEGAFEDEGEAGIWFEEVNGDEQKRANEQDAGKV